MDRRVPTPVLTILQALIEERTGLHYRAGDVDLLEQKLVLRAQEAGFDSLLDYYYFLRYDSTSSAEMDALTEALVVGETYFFRELEQLEVLVRRLVRPLVETGARPRVWSAACASGEEPLSLAMLLAEEGLLGRVDLVASDISAAALARAQRGLFGPRSLREPVPPLAARWLTPADRGWRVAPELLAAVSWRRANLRDPGAVRELGAFDYILCRNVLIYFADATSKRVIDSLAEALRPGGALFVGVSESILRLGTSLECEEHEDVFLYRRRS